MTTPGIDAAKVALAATGAEMTRLRARIRAEHADQGARSVSAGERPERRAGTANGLAAARARYPRAEAPAPRTGPANRLPRTWPRATPVAHHA
jgi:hypothetical protein